MKNFEKITCIQDICWTTWKPRDIATLLFVFNRNDVLLIHKKRGLGAQKINAPGGKLHPGETTKQCAIRELHEEVGLTTHSATWCGENLFQFLDGYSMHVHVFTTHTYSGTPIETDEASPFWVDKTQIPYHAMWEDDYLWIPMMMQNIPFSGKYLFDQEHMIDFSIHPIQHQH